MPTDVIMPQMGESIFEGTLTKWLKKPGDKVQRDEPLFEISTDKVDAEIPAPASGILKEVKVAEGTTVQVNTVVGLIDAEGSAVAAAPAPAPKPAAAPPAPKAPEAAKPATSSTPKPAAPPATPARPAAAPSGPGTNVIMPQMGESIFEGTLTKWLKKVGEKVARDEPLFEISTDKVDAEIPAPASGILSEIKVPAGQTVQVNTVVAVIGGTAGATAAAPAANGRMAEAAPAGRDVTRQRAGEEEAEVSTTMRQRAEVEPAAKAKERQAVAQHPSQVISFPAADRTQEGQRIRSSPLVRRIARENNVTLGNVAGTGLGGRITKNDILGFIDKYGKGGAPAAAQMTPAPVLTATAPARPPVPSVPSAPAHMPPPIPGEVVPMTSMRKKIAERMVESKHTSAHVHTVFKVDMTRIVRIRERERARFEQAHGVKLTYMPFIAKALMAGIKAMPIINASVEGESIRYHRNINIGIAVALDWGLIVPVVKQAEERSFLGLQRAINDLGERARNKKLVPDEVQAGTITITNPGIFGPQFGTPIILQPQLAILGMGGIFKEPIVVTDRDF
jgi:2-oxoglutarate dehydrogenase E2 component (dihydrolipoamide succinyltransferase)